MTECEKLRNDLKAFLDGQLSPAARIALRLHLNRCELCRKELEEMRQLGNRMRSADTLEMSDALRSRILASVPTTAPEAKVKMLPKWREKPVLIWGASASALLAWFVLYPTIDDYQHHAHHVANNRSIGLASMTYSQDYDENLPSGTPLAHHYVGGKNNAVPSWMTRRTVPENLQYHAGVGKAPGDSGVVRQTVLLSKADPSQQDHTSSQFIFTADADNNAPPETQGNHINRQTGNGDGNPVGNATVTPTPRIEVTLHEDHLPHDGSERSDRRYIPPSQNLMEEGISDGHVRYGAPLRSNGNVRIGGDSGQQIAQADKNNIEVFDRPIESNTQAIKPYGPNVMYRTPSSHASAVPGIRNGLPAAYSPATIADDLPTERQVHKEASLTVEVANAEQQSESVERLVKESKGYVAQNQLQTVDDGTRQASLICKVPVDQFDTVMGQMARLGLLKGKTLSGEDITDKVSDEEETGHVLRADIVTTQEKLKARRHHSDAVHDEETLRQLRIRVAQSQARLKMLTRLGALSEITVELDEKPKNAAPEVVKPASPFMEEISGTGQSAAHSFLMALRLPVQLLVWIVVYSPLWALIIYGYRRMTR